MLSAVIVLDAYSSSVQGLTLLIIIGVSLAVQQEYRPFATDSLNRLEYGALVLTGLHIYVGLYLAPQTLGTIAETILFIVALLSSLVYCWLWQWVARHSRSSAGIRSIVPHVLGKGPDRLYRLVGDADPAPRSATLNPNATMKDLYWYAFKKNEGNELVVLEAIHECSSDSIDSPTETI